eukprot:CAMPEP_0119551158 /NCGR_PEP_ID=MMETSP1352-20130426/4489_1 /TAXON_ID=265584 /ORGANISM="Stauroneis constricta, Strain CCMP1120" /LENGTH=556 /DNA_ID=CAMNT_0007597167 /DNA_START=63 /DNA_END=1733 /DNA_ORIENTATION=-
MTMTTSNKKAFALAIIAGANAAQAFTSNGGGIKSKTFTIHRAEHLQYANLEQSNLFTASRQRQQRQQQTTTFPSPADYLDDCDSLQQQQYEIPQHVASHESFLEEDSFDSSAMSSSEGMNHHAARDWWYNLKSLPQSSVLREIRHPVSCMAAWGTAVSIMHRVFTSTGKAALAQQMTIPHAAHAFLVSMLSLLLVFRTNSAYQRFQEGRKIWEDILNISRNFSRMVTLYRNEVGEERVGHLKNMVAAFPYLLRHHVRSGCLCKDHHEVIPNEHKLELKEPSNGRQVVDTRYEGDKVAMQQIKQRSSQNKSTKCFVDKRDMPWSLLDTDGSGRELKQVANSSNRPLWVCDRIGREIMAIPGSDYFTSRERLTMMSNIDKLSSTIGQCERIHQTAVPLNYARHALRALSLWLFTLPFALVKDLGLLTGPTTGLIAWLLFGVYQIGHMIEDPFQKSLRLSILCDSIRRDVLNQDLDGTMTSQRDSAFYGVSEYDCHEEDAYGCFSPGAPHLSTSQRRELSSDTVLPKFELEDIFPKQVGTYESASYSQVDAFESQAAWN